MELETASTFVSLLRLAVSKSTRAAAIRLYSQPGTHDEGHDYRDQHCHPLRITHDSSTSLEHYRSNIGLSYSNTITSGEGGTVVAGIPFQDSAPSALMGSPRTAPPRSGEGQRFRVGGRRPAVPEWCNLVLPERASVPVGRPGYGRLSVRQSDPVDVQSLSGSEPPVGLGAAC